MSSETFGTCRNFDTKLMQTVFSINQSIINLLTSSEILTGGTQRIDLWISESAAPQVDLRKKLI